jgi:putative transcription antitermination factor YqgF
MIEKFLSFDIGLRHTGVAINHGSLASPLTTLESSSYEEQLRQITSLANQHQPVKLIFGSPSRGPVQERVFALAADLDRLKIKSEIVDETLSTRIAQHRMIQAGSSPSKRQTKEHQVVAAMLLQEYLDNLLH